MKIGIVTAFLGNLRAGTWTYTWNLLKRLKELPGVAAVDREQRLLPGLEEIALKAYPGGGNLLAKFLWPNFTLPGKAAAEGFDLVHCTTPYGTHPLSRKYNLIKTRKVMRIAIDASTISTQGGPRTYVLGLLEALLRIDQENEYVVFYNDPIHLGRFPNAREIVLPGRNPIARLWREHVLLPAACRREKIDLLHCPKSAIPFFSPCPVVVTLHDLIPIKHPETEKFAAQMYWRLQIPIAARRSSFIITDSEYARQEIMADFKVEPERIKATMLGFNPAMLELRDAVEGKAIRNRYGLPESYILYVGTIQPRKNIDSLIEAYARLRLANSGTPRLVIVGRKGWLYDRLFEKISELGLTDDVLFTGFVPDEDLPFIYGGARVFAYLSLFEGFGLPPLEAMACGVPVVVSNTTSLPEVVGDAGFLVIPTDIDAIVAALKKVLDDPETAAAMRSRGLKRARTFSWERCAQETLGIYSAVMVESRG